MDCCVCFGDDNVAHAAGYGRIEHGDDDSHHRRPIASHVGGGHWGPQGFGGRRWGSTWRRRFVIGVATGLARWRILGVVGVVVLVLADVGLGCQPIGSH